MQYILTPPTDLQADIVLPASKSISNRALILHALSGGSTRPSNLSDCDDTRVLIQALDHPAETIDIGAAGTAMRFLTAYLSVTPGTHVLTGTPRMQQRPIGILVDALRSLGAQITYTANEGFPPLHITGNRLDGQEVTLAGNVSSQYISALLMIGSVLPQGLTLHLTGDIISRPYINLTLQLIKDFGAQAAWTSAHSITVYAGGYRDTVFTVESDWSAASYWYEILALFLARNPNKRQQASIRLAGLFERSSLTAACRELLEETGIAVGPEDMTLLAQLLLPTAHFDLYAVTADVPLSQLTLQPGETDQAQWLPLEAWLERMGKENYLTPSWFPALDGPLYPKLQQYRDRVLDLTT